MEEYLFLLNPCNFIVNKNVKLLTIYKNVKLLTIYIDV